MNSLESGKDKIKKICEILEKETLEPAKQEVARMIQEAQLKAQTLLDEAREEGERIVADAQKKAKQQREFFEAGLKQGFEGAKERLRQDIEKTLFQETFVPWVREQTGHPEVAAQLIQALLAALEREGTEGDLSAIVPKHLDVNRVNALLGEKVLQRLQDKGVVIGSLGGGVQLKLHKQHLTLDLSDEAIVELLVGYVAKEFRDVIFR